MFYVYRLDRPWNGVPCYIGKGRGSRAWSHAYLGVYHYNTHLARVFAKAGDTPLSVTIIAEGLTEDEAFALEIKLIAEIGRASLGAGPLCNQTDGGDGVSGRRVSVETRAKIKSAFDAAKRAELSARMTPEKREEYSLRAKEAATKKPASRPRAGLKNTEEHNSRIRAAWTLEKKAAKSEYQKQFMTPERRAAHSALMKGRLVSEETKAKMSIARTAYWEKRRASI